MADMLVYRAEGAAVASGHDLYGFRVTRWNLPATYPPFAAMLFVPTTWLPLGVLRGGFVLGNLGLLAALTHLSLRFTARPGAPRASPAALLAVLAGALWLEPVFQTFVYGQINLALAVLVLWDLSRPDGARCKGFAIGIAAGIKLTPAIFAVYLALTGRTREAATAAAAFAGTVLLGIAVLPGASVDFWTTRLYETDRVGKLWIVDNQSLQGLIARLLHTPRPGPVWVAAAVLTTAAGLAIATRAARRGLEAWGVLCTAVTALLVSPISWSHHWVWCVPLLTLLAAHTRGIAWRRGAVLAAAAAFACRSMWLTPHQGDLDLHLPWWQQPLASPYPLLGLAVLTAVATRLRRST
ncbi:glycosyltransferase 87 family protein [Streptomyces sp. H10-C2]|uniref:glycosyltransferase 87 family protein n=1 Tax=unclassified Streptomyces TaxID=2593676 RepID=UPI0024BB715C|nr:MULTISPECIES: glycosyltransferase 87 family protein [unclassified Streptomyces]MDJ0347582.1 glycosyltransferase 87 family protein [Streptomyces sp. PH10-H1]MDJ0375127.1 glycosyltransferase 87 family protein [Streptomyces sp. H10-C2]